LTAGYILFITRLASNEIHSHSNKIHREVGRAKDLSAKFEAAVPGTISIFLDCFIKHFVFGSHNHLAYVAVTRRMVRGKVLYTSVVHMDKQD
jgi:hypothetical protein